MITVLKINNNIDDVLSFVNHRKIFSSNSHHGWEWTKNICNSSRSRIANLAFSNAALASDTTIYTKLNKFKLCIWIFFINKYLTTTENNFF